MCGLDDFKLTVGRLSKLRYELQTNKPMYKLTDKHADVELWNQYYDKEKERNGMDPCWFTNAWLYVECFMYRSIKETLALSMFLKDFDPFEEQKRSAFMSSQTPIVTLANHLLHIVSSNEHRDADLLEKDFRHMVELSLWGNKNDLSISGGSENYQKADPLEQLDELQPYILVDQINDMWRHLKSCANRKCGRCRIDIILDNAGFELFGDLCFAEFLLRMGLASEVHLHAKAMPWFVSDTTSQDFWWTLEMLQASNNGELSRLGTRWHQHIKDETFFLKQDDFWTLPHNYAELRAMAPQLYQDLSASDLVVFKGDLNYRKLTGDLQWPHTTPFVDALQGFLPAPLCVLRTLKADLVVGLQEGQDKQAEEKASDWMVSGNFAVVQFYVDRAWEQL
ncbi:PREDICTED: protein-glutamate O-methyltransferase-like isoform X2 [Priapulus caudatus]|uniref:Sugar phosphate phosphatase n=1 Tax=Priapulus caudatus TaxID=37621 RepID=A0ABM1DTI0_PRICU|nr:PREDICTED: protein-glutamate O-methyltransferase-like isoform X2 [Priapulus caudatus]